MLMLPLSATASRWFRACLKCVSSLRRLEKTLKFSEMRTCPWPGAEIWSYGPDKNERNWLQFLFCFNVFTGKAASVIGMRLFQLCFRFKNEVFSYCTLTETFAIGFQKWFGHEWIDFAVFLEKDFFRWTTICIDWNLQELLTCCSFLTKWIFFDL